MTQQNLGILRNIIIAVNMAIILGLASLINIGSVMIINSGLAKDFLLNLSYIPQKPLTILFFSTGLFALYLFNLTIREQQLFFIQNYAFSNIMSFILEILTCLAIIYITNFNYKGIFLLTIVNLFSHIKFGNRGLLVFSVILLYIFCEYDLASNFFPAISINSYINNLPEDFQINTLVIKNILFSLNDVLFVIYLIFGIQIKIKENTLINQLYEKQNQMNEELKLANIQLQHYIEKSEETTKMRERNRFAREIHDTIGHSVTAISAGLDACKELLTIDSSKVKTQLDILSGISIDLLKKIRLSVKQLRPDPLEQMSLPDAIMKLADDISKLTSTKVYFQFIAGGNINGEIEDIIYRVIQESITNSIKHGKATSVRVLLRIEATQLVLQIEDNGIGCPDMIVGCGLQIMIDRIRDVNGIISFDGRCGFKTELLIPMMEDLK